MSKTVYDIHYPELRKIILHGLLYEQLKYAIRKSVIIVMMESLRRSNPEYFADENVFTDAYTKFCGKNVDDMTYDGFEIILNAVGDGTLKDGIYRFIDRVNTPTFAYGMNYSITDEYNE